MSNIRYLRPKHEVADWLVEKLELENGRPTQITGQIWAAIDNGRIRAWIVTDSGDQSIDPRRL